MPIDYSKWDNLDEYSDDDDEVNEDSSSTPRVTRLDAPSRVTFGGGLATAESQSSTSNKSTTTSSNTAVSKSTQAAAPTVANEAWTQKGGVVTTSSNRQLYWSQDRYSVSLRFEVEGDEKIQSVQALGVLPYADRHCAVGSTKPQLKICNNISCLLEGDLPHQVHLAQCGTRYL